MRKKILVCAYAVSPYKGSEFGAAWNAIVHLAKYYDLQVLYGVSDEHLGDTETMKTYLQTNSIENVQFIEVRPGKFASAINLLNKAGITWFFYLAYRFWQKEVFKKANEIVSNERIDLVHQMGMIGFRAPGYLWQLDKPYVWGPIAGTHTVDTRLLEKKPFKVRIKYQLKNAINKYQLKYSARIKKAMQRADVLIAARGIDQLNIEKYYGKKSFYLSEQGIMNLPTLDTDKLKKSVDVIDFVWSGRHDEGKNLSMCLEAFSKVKSRNWKLHVLGTGPLTEHSKALANQIRIQDNIIWYGHVDRTTAIEIMSKAHLHIITSITEGNPAVLFEAMSFGIPTLTLDHCGMADVVCDKCGFKIPINDYDKVVEDIADKLEAILIKPEILDDLALGTKECAKAYAWDRRLDAYGKIYEQALSNYNASCGSNERLDTLMIESTC